MKGTDKEIFTIEVFLNDTSIDNKETMTIYYNEFEVFKIAHEFKKANPDYKVFVNFGEYETKQGDILGDIFLSEEIK